MTDEEFIRKVEDGTIPGFHHRDHLRLTWIYLQAAGVEEAYQRVSQTIKTFAARHGHSAKYHETITRFWVLLMAYAMRHHPYALSFEDLILAEPHLLEKRLPWKHWSEKRLMSDEARTDWLEPDIAALPWSMSAGSAGR